MSSVENLLYSRHIIEGTGLTEFYFDIGDRVWRISDLTQPPGLPQDVPFIEYRIVAFVQNLYLSDGSSLYSSRVPGTRASSAGYVYDPPESQLADQTTPFFYILERVLDARPILKDPLGNWGIHESDLLTNELLIAYVQDQLPDWWGT